MYSVREAAPGVWQFTEEDKFCSYLVLGSERGLLIDTGIGSGRLWEEAEKHTDLPYDVVLTHSHFDHAGCAGHYDVVFCHVNELLETRAAIGKMPYAVAEGFRFDLGGRLLTVVELFGHTKGSIGLLDAGNRLLFTGDMLGDRPVHMTSPDADLRAYVASMDRLLGMREQVDTCFGAHSVGPIPLETAGKLKKCAQTILNGEAHPQPCVLFNGRPGLLAQADGAGMLLWPGRDYTK